MNTFEKRSDTLANFFRYIQGTPNPILWTFVWKQAKVLFLYSRLFSFFSKFAPDGSLFQNHLVSEEHPFPHSPSGRDSCSYLSIYHKEANEAIQGKAKALTCILEDGTVLNGFTLGNENDPVMLYFPEADEDAAQFLAQVDSLPGTNIVAFNYRGSAQNKGTPSEDTFENDAKQITECAAQVNGHAPQTLVGRGMGAISAINQHTNHEQIILIDPIFDIADAIHQKYGFLYPKFLIRTNFKVSTDKLKKAQNNTTVLFDKKQFEERTKAEYSKLEGAKFFVRNGESLQKVLILSQKRNLF